MAGPAEKLKGRSESLGIGSLIARSRRLVWKAASRRLDEMGESVLVWSLMNQLANRGPSTQRELATASGQHPAGVCRLLATLEEQEFVCQRRDPKDRRKVRVELTEKGIAHLLEMDPHVGKASDEVLTALDPDERKTLRRLLEKLLAGSPESAGPRKPRIME